MDTSLPRRLLMLAGAGLFVPVVTHANSFDPLDRQLERQEIFFQPMDRPAPDFTLQDDNGGTVGLNDLRGKMVVLNFIYARCPDVCPLQTGRIALLQRMLKTKALRSEVRFVSVTADPVHDTPDVMKAYGEQHGLDPATWLFLTSGPNRPDATRELAQKGYHNRYQVEPDGSITPSLWQRIEQLL